VLRTIQTLREQVPVIGINYGEVGFLADLEPDEAVPFLTALAPPVPVERRMRISLERNGEPIGQALNEALIVTSNPAKMLRFSILIDGIAAEVFRADGLLVSTPTGSTAYAMSAGGPIVDPRIEGFLLVPLAPYMLSSRPHLISCDRTLRIRLESPKPAKLVVDGQKTWDMGQGEVLTVRRSSSPALFIDTGKNFFEKVDAKLRHL
jgi:NAD+ kinase